MPRKPAPLPSQELPLFENLVQLGTRLAVFAPKDPTAKLAFAEVTHAQELWVKDIKEAMEEQLTKRNEPVLDLKALERDAKDGAGILESMLKRAKLQGELAAALKESTGPISFFHALVGLARKSGGEAMAGYADEVATALKRLSVAEKRVSQGGHPIFGDAVAKTATKIWIIYDNGYDALGMNLRRTGVRYDEFYANRSTVKTSLRPELLMKSPVPPGAKRKAAGEGKKKAKQSVVKAPEAPKPAADPKPADVSNGSGSGGEAGGPK